MSGGMAQRIVIAIALVCSPKFIVSDDATSGLDVTVQAQILDLLRRLAQDRGSSMLFITRDIGITAHFCDRVAVIYNGEIMELAARENFFFRPAHPYTIMLMAAFSYNQRLRQMWARPEPLPGKRWTKTPVPISRVARWRSNDAVSIARPCMNARPAISSVAISRSSGNAPSRSQWSCETLPDFGIAQRRAGRERHFVLRLILVKHLASSAKVVREKLRWGAVSLA